MQAIILSVASWLLLFVTGLLVVLFAPITARAQNYCLLDTKSAGVLEITAAGKSNYLPCTEHNRPEAKASEASGKLRTIAKNLLGFEAVGTDRQPAIRARIDLRSGSSSAVIVEVGRVVRLKGDFVRFGSRTGCVCAGR